MELDDGSILSFLTNREEVLGVTKHMVYYIIEHEVSSFEEMKCKLAFA